MAEQSPSQNQIFQNRAKPGQGAAKFFQGKSLDFLGFPCSKRAFSMGYRDPPGKKSFCFGSVSRIKRANAGHFLTLITTEAIVARIPLVRKTKPLLKASWRDRQIKA
jgi:hypothetical protein